MTLPRIYSPDALADATSCELGVDNLRYLKTVLRLKPGDPIRVFDGFGHEFEACVEQFRPTGVKVVLQNAISMPPKPITLVLAQGIPKAGKMDLIVKTASELGTDIIIPFVADRSVGRMETEKATGKVVRWQKIVQEAARCTRSAQVALVEPVMTFDEMLLRAKPEARKLIFWEEEDLVFIRDVLCDKTLAAASQYFIIVGPEGGLSRDEVGRARQAGFISVSLGKHILKVETAAAAVLSIIQYEKGILSRQKEEGKA